MENSVTTRTVELLIGQYDDRWTSERSTAKWKLNSANELQQLSMVGDRHGGSGAITVFKSPVSSPLTQVTLNCRPGTQHQTGIIFNYVDARNFCAFSIDVHTPKSGKYDVLAFEVNAGNYDLISKQSYKGKINGAVNFLLKQADDDLVLVLNDVVSYTWKGMLLFGKRLGIYSYKNTDAVFLSLTEDRIAVVPVVQPQSLPLQTVEPVIVPVVESTEQHPTILAYERIGGFLGIREPASKTEIEFTEVFTVPLDSFYSSIYSSGSENETETSISGSAEVQLLDLRVKRWYRDLKTVREDIVSARKDLDRKQDRISGVEKQLKNEISDVEYAKLETNLLERRVEARSVLRRINSLRDLEGLLLREIRVNGYSLVDDTDNDVIRKLGYDFHLVGQAMTTGEYDPVEFESNLDLSDDDVWNEAQKKLHQRLFDTQAITDKGISLYERENPTLLDFKSFPGLVEKEKQLIDERTRIEDIKPLYDRIVKEVELELADWGSDKAFLAKHHVLLNQINNPFPWVGVCNSYYIKQFYDQTVGWLDNDGTIDLTDDLYPIHPDFKRDVLGKPNSRRVKLNMFKVDIHANYLSSVVDSAFGVNGIITIHQALGLYCPEIGVDFYQRSEFNYQIAFYHQSYNNIYVADYSAGSSRFGTNNDFNDFYKAADKVCDHFIAKTIEKLESARSKVRDLERKITEFNEALVALSENGLAYERRKFLEKWNDPATNFTSAVSSTIHLPEEDPLAEFLASISGHNETSAVETYFFSPTPDGFYNQNGLSLVEFMRNRTQADPGPDVICVFPVFDGQGRISSEMVKAVRRPFGSGKQPSLPTIKFVENYRVEVGWLGFGLGELSHSFNLFPGESKELVIEKSTKLSTKTSQTTSSEENTTTHLTSSFEDNLQNELSVGEKAAQERSSMNKNDASQSASTEETSTLDVHADVSASGGIGIASGKASAGFKSGSNSKRNSAYSTSQSAEEKRASNQSKDILSKNISNAVRKVASDTSQNNKLAFTAVSSREYEESTTNREVIKLQNPNVGKTVNYNFFQVQNLYGVTTKLVDVQIVIDTGVEMVKGTGINDVRVYDLEEFGKMFANSQGTDRAATLAAIIARQVFKHYGDFLPGITSGNGSLSVPAGVKLEREILEVLNFSSDESGNGLKERTDRIKTALNYLKGIPFVFRDKILSQEANVAVNCAAYHMESQLGFLAATETYLEDRREIETNKQRALVEHVKAQTKAGVFFQEQQTEAAPTAVAIIDKKQVSA